MTDDEFKIKIANTIDLIKEALKKQVSINKGICHRLDELDKVSKKILAGIQSQQLRGITRNAGEY